MMHLFPQIFLVALLTSFLFLMGLRRRENGRKNVLPRPSRLPIIGNLHQVASCSPHLKFHELSKTYGPLMSLKLGFIPTLVVSSAESAKEVLKTQDLIFSNRPKLAAQQKLSYNGLDIGFAPYGESWRQLKKVSALHLFSSKKVQSFSSIREEEVREMTQKISCLSEEGRVIDLSEMIMSLSSTVMCKMAFGRRKYDGDKYVRCGRTFIDMAQDAQQVLISFFFSDYFPCIGWVLDNLTGTSTRLHKIFMELDGFYDVVIDEHRKSSRPEAGEGDIVDVLLDLQRDNSLGINITVDHIKGILMNIFIAGIDTSASTIIWAMTELMRNPDCMKRAQEEVRTLKGNKNVDIIKEEDLENLVYLKSVVKEALRLHPPGPVLLPRETTKKCSIQGYEIEEKTRVYVNVWAIGRDPESWENPDVFSPERFLNNSNSKAIEFRGQDFELIPFGSGRRICPGMQMGVAVVELALANLICCFDWEVPMGMEEQVLDTNIAPFITMQKETPLSLLANKTFWI